MKIHELLVSVSSIILAGTLCFTPALAIPNADVVKQASVSTTESLYTLDDPIEDVSAANREFGAYVYKEKPEIYLSCADFNGISQGLSFWAKQGDNRVHYVKFTQGFLDIWNDETYADNFWNYVDSVIAGAGITDVDTDAEKVKKAAIFIGNNYHYDWQTSYNAFVNDGTPFFATLAEKQISFCMPDSRLMMACCLRMGIPCTTIEGNASGLHSWNRVCIDGAWSEVDCSFARKTKNKDKYIFFTSGRTVYSEIG